MNAMMQSANRQELIETAVDDSGVDVEDILSDNTPAISTMPPMGSTSDNGQSGKAGQVDLDLIQFLGAVIIQPFYYGDFMQRIYKWGKYILGLFVLIIVFAFSSDKCYAEEYSRNTPED